MARSYDPSYFPRLAAVEERHFWFRARNRVIAAAARRITRGLGPGYHVLEVGCGTGNVLRMLEQVCVGGKVVGMDLLPEGLRFAGQRTKCALVRGDVQAAPFRRSFDLVGLFDVLEHLPDDEQVLRELRTVLAPRGKVVITVPAHPRLWSYFDEVSHHRRRYTAASLARAVTGAGYHLEYLSPYMAGILPLVWLGRRLASLWGRGLGQRSTSNDRLAAAELRGLPFINSVMTWLLAWEVRAVERHRVLPFGTSLLAVCSVSD